MTKVAESSFHTPRLTARSRGARLAELAHREVPAHLAGALLRLMEGVGPDGVGLPTRYTHQQLASMIGANLEAVKRALKTLRERGAVEVRGRRIHVVDPEALRRGVGSLGPAPNAAYEPNRRYTDRATGGCSVGK